MRKTLEYGYLKRPDGSIVKKETVIDTETNEIFTTFSGGTIVEEEFAAMQSEFKNTN